MNTENLKIRQIFTLAYENHRKSNLKLAESLYNKILKIDPNHTDTIFLLGTLFLQKKKFQNAIELFHKVLAINPNHVNAIHNLGFASIEIGKPKEAKELLKKAIQMQPKHLDAHYNLGNVYKHLGEFQEAEESYQKAIQVRPQDPKIYNNLGNVLKELGKFNEAISSYKKAIKIQYNHSNAYHNLANTYKQLGEFGKAESFYQKAFQYQPTNLETLLSLTELNKEILDENLKKLINKILKNKNVSKKNMAYGHFLLAKYALKEKDLEKEFNYLLKGHSEYFDFKKKPYDQGVNYWLNEIPENKELMKLGKSTNFINKDNNKIKPIFIVGVPRCGSTLIEKVIASGNQKISIGEETAIISFYVGEKFAYKESFNLNIENLRKKIINKYEQKGLINKKNDYIFTDKSLDNFFFIGLIKEIFPNAKIINCRRNFLSSIMSIMKNNLGDVTWAHKPEHIFKFFDIYEKRIQSFKKIYPNFIYELQFEDFVRSPEIESKKLMEFCQLPWDKKCLEFHKRKDLTSRTASNIQIRKAIFQDSAEKYLPYKQFLVKYGSQYNWFN